MLSRLIGGLLLKALLSLGVLLGVASYAHYLSGGDPGALWQRVAGGALGGAADAFGELGERVRVPDVTLAVPTGEAARRDSVWSWRDADGVVHYASAPPAGIEATRITLDPNANVLAPLAPPAPSAERSGPRSGAPSGAPADLSSVASGGGAHRGGHRETDGYESLPGIGGAVLRARGDAPSPDPARAEALLKLLQPSHR